MLFYQSVIHFIIATGTFCRGKAYLRENLFAK